MLTQQVKITFKIQYKKSFVIIISQRETFVDFDASKSYIFSVNVITSLETVGNFSLSF